MGGGRGVARGLRNSQQAIDQLRVQGLWVYEFRGRISVMLDPQQLARKINSSKPL